MKASVEGSEREFLGLFGLGSRRRFGERRGVDRIGSALRREEDARCEHDQAEAEIGREGLHREEEERRDERETQIQGIEAEILAHGLADTEEGIAAAEEIGGFVLHFSVFPFGCGHRPLPMRQSSQRPCQIVQFPKFLGFFRS